MFCGPGAPAQVSARPFTRGHCTASSRREAHVWMVRCAVCPQEEPPRAQAESSRRLVTISSLLLFRCLSLPNHVLAGSIFDKYVKRKKLDPLEVYVPPVILTRLQIEDLEKILEAEQPEYAACRSLLRAGPAASLRVNIRAVAQYALEDGYSKTAFDGVDQCLRALEELDSLLLHASRNDPKASINSMKANIGKVLSALDSLLQTVPPDVLDKGRAIADAYRSPAENTSTESLDEEMKQLESIL